MKFESSITERIASEIRCDKSPVGIDATKTHVLILAMLERIDQRQMEMESRLKAIESQVDFIAANSD